MTAPAPVIRKDEKVIVDLERKWVKNAACKGMADDLFFTDHSVNVMTTGPTKKVAASWERAKKICGPCPVKYACLRDSLGEIEGVFGGADPLERAEVRRLLTDRVRNMEGPRRREYEALAHRLANTPHYGRKEAARIMGLSLSLVNQLVSAHEKALEALRAQREARRQKVVDLPLPEREWPAQAPVKGDGWVRSSAGVVHGYYVGETEDGEWIFMKGPVSGREDSMSWYRKRDVHLTRSLPRVVKNRVGKQSRIYGTTISPQHGAATKAG
jgi:hypothetical protein